MIRETVLPTLRANGRLIAKITIPVFFEQLSMVLTGVVNTALAASLGNTVVSAIGLADAITATLLTMISSLAVGGTVAVARAYGREDREGIDAAAGQSILAITAIGAAVALAAWFTRGPLIRFLYGGAEPEVLSAAVTFYGIVILSIPAWAYITVVNGVLRGVGDTRTTMKVSLIMSVANIVLSYVFIKGLDVDLGLFRIHWESLGVRGTALGILISRLVGVAAVTVPLAAGRRSDSPRAIRLSGWRNWRPNSRVLREIFFIGVPASAESAVFQVGKLITQTVIVGLGTSVLAANSIAWSILGLFNLPGSAANTAATTLVGQTIGEGDKRKSRAILMTMVAVSSASYVVLSLLLLVVMKPAIGAYTSDSTVFGTVRSILLSLMVPMTLLWPMSFISASGLRAAGDVRFTMVVAVASMWVFRVGGAFLFIRVFHTGILGLWISTYLDWLARTAVFGTRMSGDRWFARSGLPRN